MKEKENKNKKSKNLKCFEESETFWNILEFS